MAKEDTRFLGVYVPIKQYEAIREWAHNNDSDVSKACRAALRDFCHKEGIVVSPDTAQNT